MEIAIDYGQLNLLLSEWEHHTSIMDTISKQITQSQIQAYPLLKAVHDNMQTHCKNVQQLKTVLEASLSEYSATENHLCTFNQTQSPTTSAGGNDGSQPILTSPQVLPLLSGGAVWDILGAVSEATSFIKDAKDFSEWVDVLFDSDMFEDISDFFGDISKNDILKAAGYLNDGKKLVDALDDGNLDTLESLSEKYLKKGVKSGIKVATGVKVSGVISGVYLDLGWDLGENTVESVHDFIENPSLETGLSGIWNITAGTFFDTGTGLTKDALSFVSDFTGQWFDADDFGNAMDYLWHHPIKSAIATGEVIGDSVASFFDWLF